MPQQNMISIEIPEAELTEIKGAIELLQQKLTPYLKAVNADDKKELSKMGDKTVAFVQKSLEHSLKNPDLVPPFLDVEEFKKDFTATVALRELHQPLVQLVDLLGDSQLLAGSDSYQAALLFYNTVKSAMKSNIAKAETIYDDLASRFPTRNRKKVTEEV